jgi:hypothetical protein
MTNVTITRAIPAPPEKVWKILRTFSLEYMQGFPHTLTGSEIGAERSFKLPDGEMIERIFAFDDPGMALSYRLVKSPWPVTGYSASVRVAPGEVGAAVTWTADFEPDGVTEEAAVQIVEGTIKLNLRLIEKLFSA